MCIHAIIIKLCNHLIFAIHSLASLSPSFHLHSVCHLFAESLIFVHQQQLVAAVIGVVVFSLWQCGKWNFESLFLLLLLLCVSLPAVGKWLWTLAAAVCVYTFSHNSNVLMNEVEKFSLDRTLIEQSPRTPVYLIHHLFLSLSIVCFVLLDGCKN